MRNLSGLLPIKRDITVRQARRCLTDAAMRRGLLEFLWQFRETPKGITPQPMSSGGDEWVKAELKRILS